ncbi:MAG: D-alanine--D-alanine ligase [Clostridiales Family XIII bacterium]|jgi:D-alanine-D-alanine ligase|nr:D-alanine--D-alanine ligase [Clostridiales Family XIII bacterium]
MDRIGVIFGGRSREHEISVLSAASVMDAVNRENHEIVPIGINKRGEWFRISADMSGLRSLDDERCESLIPKPGRETAGARRIDLGEFARLADFAFPLLHGPYGEDGTIQGLFEMLDMPYAGCGVACSAISMDKILTKSILADAGFLVCRHVSTREFDFSEDKSRELNRIEEAFGYPIFVKPANMGSSVGISKVRGREELERAVALALRYDSRVLAEEAINGREFEVSVLGNERPSVGVVGEIISRGEFYDYESKYRDGAAELRIPADIPRETAREIDELALGAYKALDGAGFARIDFFLEEGSGKIYLNEVNTIPGFTAYSMFPLLWKAKGVTYPSLIERIIEFGYERHHAKNNR